MFPFLDAIQPTPLPALCFLAWLPLFLALGRRAGRWFFILASAATLVFVGGPPLALGLTLIIVGGYGVGEAVALVRPRAARKVVFLLALGALHAGYWACFQLLIPGGYAQLPAEYRAGAFILFSGVGLTFFRLLSYFHERVRRRQTRLGVSDYLAYMFFFPQFRHGPIERAHAFVPRLKSARAVWRPEDFGWGLGRVLLGFGLLLAVRHLIRHGAPPEYRSNAFGLLVSLFDHPEQLRWPGLLLLIHLPAAALYAVESASAHLQLGVSRMFGVRGSENFRYPFLATNPGEVWRRWNITLSFWLRDYAFLPLCRWRALRYIALVLTFVYAGLLHGLYWRHVYWGLYTGGTLAVVAWILQLAQRRRKRAAVVTAPAPVARFVGVQLARLLTMHWACWSVLIFLDPHHCGWRVFLRVLALLGLTGS